MSKSTKNHSANKITGTKNISYLSIDNNKIFDLPGKKNLKCHTWYLTIVTLCIFGVKLSSNYTILT